MVKALFFALSAALPLALVYLLGWWVLAALGVVTAAVIVLSTGQARGSEVDRGGRLTGYSTTSYAEF
jgi:hypothetical protein